MEDMNYNIKLTFKELIGCPAIDMPLGLFDELLGDFFKDNLNKSIAFDDFVYHIRSLTQFDGFNYSKFFNWWLNNHTSWYCWPQRKISIIYNRKGDRRSHIDNIVIGGLMKKYNEEKTMDRVKAGGVYHSYNGDFDTTLAMRQMINSTYGIPASLEYINIKDVIFNNPATIVFWSDGTKTVCTCSEADTYDPEKGLALCVMKRLLYKNKGHIFNNAREKWLKKGGKKR